MILCKKSIIAATFVLMLPLTGWSEAPVVDDSDRFAIIDGQQADSSAAHTKYEEPLVESAEFDSAQNDGYPSDDGPALVKEEQGRDSPTHFNDSAQLIDKIQALQQEIQELRGQLEVQAHDLKLLQQQQISFYKDLDSRLGNTSTKSAQVSAPTDISIGSKSPVVAPSAPASSVTKTVPVPVASSVSRMNPADEQISYLAAYELVKNKQYDDAINAMQVFVQKYPKGGYTANAEYWLGELYLVKNNYPKSIEHFEVVLHQFPASSKSAASMLKSAYAYAASGDKQEAKRRFQEVVKNYPGTPTAQLAKSKLESVNTL